ncbi:hypothetical protein V8C35DRAFT_292822 [Trichoderma chlorosporum]
MVPDLTSITTPKQNINTPSLRLFLASPPPLFSCDWAVMPNIQPPLANHPAPATSQIRALPLWFCWHVCPLAKVKKQGGCGGGGGGERQEQRSRSPANASW